MEGKRKEKGNEIENWKPPGDDRTATISESPAGGKEYQDESSTGGCRGARRKGKEKEKEKADEIENWKPPIELEGDDGTAIDEVAAAVRMVIERLLITFLSGPERKKNKQERICGRKKGNKAEMKKHRVSAAASEKKKELRADVAAQ